MCTVEAAILSLYQSFGIRVWLMSLLMCEFHGIDVSGYFLGRCLGALDNSVMLYCDFDPVCSDILYLDVYCASLVVSLRRFEVR